MFFSYVSPAREQAQGSYRPAPSLQDDKVVHERQALGDGRVQAAHRQETRSLLLQLSIIPISVEQDQPDAQAPAEELLHQQDQWLDWRQPDLAVVSGR